ncbi:hypothetical protein [Duganella sp. S19_KUP01_CR8]|uniref:hypothetical protein n=1 Tax=Duganella sp. S19_KUP01_CR8 TaxID=3025502 RepID=UPI002FCD86C0
MGIATTDCPVQIQIWVDDNAVTLNNPTGVYLVDNRVNYGSQNEGSANLSTATSKNSNVCWQVFLINPKSKSTVQIQSIGNSDAWGPSGQPQMAPDNTAAFTGTMQNAGNNSYSLGVTVQVPGGSGFTVKLNPSVNVSA